MAKYLFFHNRYAQAPITAWASMTDTRLTLIDVYKNSPPNWGYLPGARVSLFPTVIVTDGVTELARLEGAAVTDNAVKALGYTAVEYAPPPMEEDTYIRALMEMQQKVVALSVKVDTSAWVPTNKLPAAPTQSGRLVMRRLKPIEVYPRPPQLTSF